MIPWTRNPRTGLTAPVEESRSPDSVTDTLAYGVSERSWKVYWLVGLQAFDGIELKTEKKHEKESSSLSKSI